MAEPETLREFEFLPNLPKSNLDDRKFNDLVQECILRIPRYCPEWTNHNPGDPGITLIELFAWLTDQMLFRFNQVPRRYYVSFLELLGIRLQPPVPAHAELTFYLTKAQSQSITLDAGTEVATVRTETEEAVIFTTDQNLIIGQPRIIHLFTAQNTEDRPHASSLNRGLTQYAEPSRQSSGTLSLFETCNPGNCFYLVLDAPPPESLNLEDSEGMETENGRNHQPDSIAGNVLAFTFQGSVASTTGILPENPPLKWEAWNGEKWVDGILRQKQDDKTKGFSFSQLGQNAPNAENEGADVILHLPQQWQMQEWGEVRGYWIRCVYSEPDDIQYPYDRSPEISSITVRSIGGTVNASECVRMEEELLGVSSGKPGQVFQIQGTPLLNRDPSREFIQVKLPGGAIVDWQEVSDFGNSDARSNHYKIDSISGEVQFGPLVRESSQLLQQTQERSRRQPWGKQVEPTIRSTIPASPLISADVENTDFGERQYGRVPPIGAEIYIVSYRTGGGSRGNVEKNKLTVLKKSIPYIKQVTNFAAAQGGRDAESLDQAVMRVPSILRTAKTAITPEDFEQIATAHRSIYSAYCPPCATPGIVRLLIIRDPRTSAELTEADFRQLFPGGMSPSIFGLEALGTKVESALKAELEERKSLGIQVELAEPDYIGVQVKVEVMRNSNYRNSRLTAEVRARVLNKLYYFINPITGGFAQTGWSSDRPITPADIIALLQAMPEIDYVANVNLFSIRYYSQQGWKFATHEPEFTIHPGKQGQLCSWENEELGSGHMIEFIDPNPD